MILRIFPGSSKRKSVNGACGDGAFVLTGSRLADAGSVVWALGGVLEGLQISDNLPSLLLGEVAQDGIPLLTDPVVINQKTSPSGADCVAPWDRAGMFPVPRPLIPWHEPQFIAYSFDPAATAAVCPAYGFFS